MTRTRKFKFVIGTMDDFASIDELRAAVASNPAQYDGGVSRYEFEVPAFESDTPRDREYLTDLARYVGYGIAFSNDWCQDGTLSYLEEIV